MIHVTPDSFNQIIRIFNSRKAAVGLSDYSVGELLNHGGMSNVYRVTGSDGSTDYVLRISEEHKSSYSSDIFNVREMEILRELKKNSQPHVVQYLDAFIADIPGQPRYYCAVMKFLCTLRQYPINGDGVEIAVRLGCDFLPLLQTFMDKKILHRDIKPENIFYDQDFRNETGFLLGDFGIAKRNVVTSITPVGTESTMAPEVRGLDRSLGSDRLFGDMYSLGMVMYMYLNQGVFPSNQERIEKIPPDRNPFPEPRYGSKRLKWLVVKATSYDPKDRFESPQAMLRELQKCDEYRFFIDKNDNNEEPTASFPTENRQISDLKRERNVQPVPFVTDADYKLPYSSGNRRNEGRRASLAGRPLSKKTVIILASAAAALLVIALSGVLWFAVSRDAGTDNDVSSARSAITDKIVIIEQPSDVITKPQRKVTFKVVASGTGLEYQWYYRKKGGSSWNVWRVYTTPEIEPPANSTWDGMQVRCRVSDVEGNSFYSETASVTLVPLEAGDFQITEQPKSYKISKSDIGQKKLSFSVEANGKDMKYQWYFCKAGETAWTLWDERTASSFKAKPNETWDGMLIYCRITNYDSEELYSDIASVTIS